MFYFHPQISHAFINPVLIVLLTAFMFYSDAFPLNVCHLIVLLQIKRWNATFSYCLFHVMKWKQFQ